MTPTRLPILTLDIASQNRFAGWSGPDYPHQHCLPHLGYGGTGPLLVKPLLLLALFVMLSTWSPFPKGTALPLLVSDTELQQLNLMLELLNTSSLLGTQMLKVASKLCELPHLQCWHISAEASSHLVLATVRCDTRVNRESLSPRTQSMVISSISLSNRLYRSSLINTRTSAEVYFP